MAMNYNKLWKILIDRNMMKKDLIQLAGISTNAMAKKWEKAEMFPHKFYEKFVQP